MKRLAITLTFIFGLISISAQDKTSALPDIKLKGLDGKLVNLADYGTNGKVTVVNFWATWCKPCVKELNAINEQIEDWQEEMEFDFIAISLDDAQTVSRVKGFVDAKIWDAYIVLLDPNNDTKRFFNFQNPPYTLLVDKEGKIVYTHQGYIPGDEEFLREEIAKYAE